jgi:hypothetical protein
MGYVDFALIGVSKVAGLGPMSQKRYPTLSIGLPGQSERAREKLVALQDVLVLNPKSVFGKGSFPVPDLIECLIN